MTSEIEVIGGVAWGAAFPEHWEGKSPPADLFDIKSDIEALLRLTGSASAFSFVAAEHTALRPGRTARIERDGVDVGWCGELHPAGGATLGLKPGTRCYFEMELAKGLQANVPPSAGFRGFRRCVVISQSSLLAM